MGKPVNWSSTSGNNESDPCPKGWHLPKREEFLSFFPFDHSCGDISFSPSKDNADKQGRYDGLNGHPSGFDHSKDSVYIEKITVDYNNQPGVYVGIYKDGEGYDSLVKEVIGEKKNDKGEVVKDDEGNVVMEVKTAVEGWGSVYSIKNQGTESAYAIRWQIKIVGYDPKTKQQT